MPKVPLINLNFFHVFAVGGNKANLNADPIIWTHWLKCQKSLDYFHIMRDFLLKPTNSNKKLLQYFSSLPQIRHWYHLINAGYLWLECRFISSIKTKCDNGLLSDLNCYRNNTTYKMHTLESGINVAPWINVASGKFDKKNKRSPLKYGNLCSKT